MKRAWPRKAAFIKGVIQDFFMNSPPSYDFRTTPLPSPIYDSVCSGVPVREDSYSESQPSP